MPSRPTKAVLFADGPMKGQIVRDMQADIRHYETYETVPCGPDVWDPLHLGEIRRVLYTIRELDCLGHSIHIASVQPFTDPAEAVIRLLLTVEARQLLDLSVRNE